ncbi:hypothetical protein SDC9_186675 [bioreactor metagenome]|uniref:Uncharacterized protein n=1 Tax=bioreactor metagenome TaxID=1076179 RepID=A0A645HJJ1_9ZZZZ|nr:hypothetical protein [Candidatus Pelethousia sp.]NCB29874.1 hypothetical protein [Clostridia bacterium]
MKRFLLNRRVQKAFLPLAMLCLIPIWLLLRQGAGSISPAVYVLGALGALLFLLDRFFKPWELTRAEQQRRRDEEATLHEAGAPTTGASSSPKDR